MPLLPLFYLHHRADGTAVLMAREPSAPLGRPVPPQVAERASTALQGVPA